MRKLDPGAGAAGEPSGNLPDLLSADRRHADREPRGAVWSRIPCWVYAAGAARANTGAGSRVGGGPDADAMNLPRVAEPAPAVPPRFTLGDWIVDVPARRLRRGDRQVVLEPRVMAVLARLCARPGEVVGPAELLQAGWPEEPHGDNPVHKAIAGLRRALDDAAVAPRYIETIRRRGYRLLAPIRVLSAQGPRSHCGAWRDQSPFRGLEPFGPAHAGVYFGRDEAVALLHGRLDARWRAGDPLVVLLGPSGSGKTSLVQAGLLPALVEGLAAVDASPPGGGAEPSLHPTDTGALRACAAATLDLAALGGLDPWSALAGAWLDWEVDGVPLLSGHSIATLAQGLRHAVDEVLDDLRMALEALPGRFARRPPLLVLDRLEALFAPRAQAVSASAPFPAPGEAAFLATVEQLVRSRLLLVLVVCRNDFYPALARHPRLMSGKADGGHVDLAPPGSAAIAQMIRLPAQAAGLVYGTDPTGLYRLDDRLCADAMQAPDALPLLQYTLQTLYAERRTGDVLDWDTYEQLGGLEGAIGRRAEALLASLPAAQQAALDRLLPRLVGLGGPGDDEAGPTSRWWPAREGLDDPIDADLHALVRALVEARLLVADHAGGQAGYRVAHEALLRRWPRVTAWIARHRAALGCLDELRPWVRRWQQAGRAPGSLMPSGAVLWQASRLLDDPRDLLADDEQDFVRASLARLRRQRRLRLVALAGAVGLATVAALAALAYAHQARVAAERWRQSQQLASFMLGELADRLRPLGRLDLLGRLGEQGLQLLGADDLGSDRPQDRLQRARALVVIGEVNSSRGRGQTALAVAALEQAWRLLDPQVDATGPAARDEVGDRASASEAGLEGPGLATAQRLSAEHLRTWGACAFWLGQIAFDQGDFDRAALQMARYRDIARRWQREHPDDAQAPAELGYALHSLGAIAVRRGDWPAAERWFQDSLALKQAVLARRGGGPTAESDAESAADGVAEKAAETTAEKASEEAAAEGVANSRIWLGLVHQVRGRPLQALALYDAAHTAHLAAWRRHPSELVRLWDLGTLEVRRAEALAALGRHDAARQTMEDGLRHLRRAGAHDPSNRRWRAERLHAEAGAWLLRAQAHAARADGAATDAGRRREATRAGAPVIPAAELERLRRELLQPDLAEADGGWLARETAARLAVLQAWGPGGGIEPGLPAALSTARYEATQVLRALLADRPGHWQGRELQARLWLRSGETRPAACAQARAELQPAVDAGQAGVVLEAWIVADRCAAPAAPAAAAASADAAAPSRRQDWISRLVAGGYVPAAATLFHHRP